jgi:transcription elongation factor GreA
VSDQPAQQELSKAAYDRLAAELEELQTDGRKEIAERLQRARELGDLSENAEYHETKNQQGLMEARIRTLEHIIRNAVIVDTPQSADVATAGTFVTLRPVDGGEEEKYLLAATKEERSSIAYTMTTSSPLGKALAGKAVGEKISYDVNGRSFSYELVKIEPWDGS